MEKVRTPEFKTPAGRAILSEIDGGGCLEAGKEYQLADKLSSSRLQGRVESECYAVENRCKTTLKLGGKNWEEQVLLK